ncbi:MAG: hypothetical protein ACOX83_09140 [Candidatus Spyradocola sp.]|jgi:hypothetical protein
MYQELVKYPTGTRSENVLYIVGIVLGVFLVSILSWLLSSWGVPMMDFLAVAILAVWAFFIFSRRIVEYRYALMDSEFIVGRIVGGREKPVFSLEVTDIQSIGPVEKKSHLRTQRFALRTSKLTAVQIVYRRDGQEQRVILQPSGHMLRLIYARAFPQDKSDRD